MAERTPWRQHSCGARGIVAKRLVLSLVLQLLTEHCDR